MNDEAPARSAQGDPRSPSRDEIRERARAAFRERHAAKVAAARAEARERARAERREQQAARIAAARAEARERARAERLEQHTLAEAVERARDAVVEAAAGAAAAPPVAGPAVMRRRHWGLVAGLVVVVLLPFLATVAYLYLVARDQYASTTGFTVRTEETSSASDLLGGLGAFVGSSTSGNAYVLNAFIQSQEIVARINDRLDLIGHWSQGWPDDPVFTLWPTATIEDLLWFWRRMVLVTFDPSTNLMDVQVRARDPDTAQAIATAIVEESERMINALNEQARRDSMANAERDLEIALDRLRRSREALAQFRARTQIVDPQADIQGRMGVINNLQQQLAQALVDHDLLLQVTTDTDPRVRQAVRRIEVINDRISEERRNFATQDVTVFDTDYPRLIAQFESLRVDQEFAEQTYRAALTALDSARSNAARQNLYLATYIRPTRAERSEYPERLQLSLLVLGLLVLIWAVMALVYYSIRDRG